MEGLDEVLLPRKLMTFLGKKVLTTLTHLLLLLGRIVPIRNVKVWPEYVSSCGGALGLLEASRALVSDSPRFSAFSEPRDRLGVLSGARIVAHASISLRVSLIIRQRRRRLFLGGRDRRCREEQLCARARL